MESRADYLMCNPKAYHIIKTEIWKNIKPSVLKLHQAVWNAGYRVNGYKPPYDFSVTGK